MYYDWFGFIESTATEMSVFPYYIIGVKQENQIYFKIVIFCGFYRLDTNCNGYSVGM